HCLRISAKTDDIMDKPCLFVKDAIGVHTANSLTGDFSVETANAFLCENGEFVKPVKKAMISGNVFDILKSSITISKETKTFDGAVVPRIRIPDMQVI
ncbi:MAG TPA: metallopeptidase TldD-related protein, partial [Methanocorpusculum sp.]|nr:metallopeptidase TldD-related protein [Methanocorpusculum sp.]